MRLARASSFPTSIPMSAAGTSPKCESRRAAADLGPVQEDAAEAVLASALLHRGPGIGDRDEVLAGVLAVHGADLVVEILEEDVWLGRAARLGRDDVEGLPGVASSARASRPPRGRSSRAPGRRRRPWRRRRSGAAPRGERQPPCRRGRHGGSRPCGSSAKVEVVDLGEHQVDDVEPTHADLDLRLVRGVVGFRASGLLPEALGSFASSIWRASLGRRARRSELRHREIGEQQRPRARPTRRRSATRRTGERRDAVVLELLRDRVHADSGVLDPLQHGGGLVDALFERSAGFPWSRWATMVAGGIVSTVSGPMSAST